MHRSLAAAFLLTLSAAPAFAQDAMRLDDAQALYASTKISSEADIALYCASAFNLLALKSITTNKANDVKTFRDRSAKLLDQARKLLVNEGLSDEQSARLNDAVSTIVTAQIVNGTEKPKYSRDDCTTLASKLK